MKFHLTNRFKLTAVAIATLSGLAACGGGDSNPDTVAFTELAAPANDAERQLIRTTTEVDVSGRKYTIGFTPWAKSGDAIGAGTNNIWGQHVDYLGNPLNNYSDQDLVIGANKAISSSPDHTTLLQKGSKLFSITQFEELNGFMYITELAQNAATGALTPVATKPVDLSGIYGGWDFCAGMPTPWGSHLGGEEYPIDVRKLEASDVSATKDLNAYLEYFGYDHTLVDGVAKANSRTAALARTSPYRVGFPVEIKLTGDSLGAGKVATNTEATKHYSMGRIAWELAYVMPNKKTVYSGDDGTNRGMFRYEAATAGDLSSGTLYTAKLTQTNTKSTATAGGGEFTLSWISLGSASDAQISGFIGRGIKFSDMFDYQAPVSNACGPGYTPSIANDVSECLKLKTTNDLSMTADEIKMAASRLETLRYAVVLGGTAEFRKFEGVTFDEKRRKLYIAMSTIGKSMSSSPTLAGVSDDILVQSNVCGAVYQLDVDANYVTTNMKALVAGIPRAYVDRPIQTDPTNSATVTQQACDDAGIALPDNVTMGPTDDILIIGEDGTTEHQNDFLWAYNLNNGNLTRIASGHYGGELTSPYYYRNINGFDYMTLVAQHPYDESDYFKGPDVTYGKGYGALATSPASGISVAKANAMRAQAGYLGPFPVVKR